MPILDVKVDFPVGKNWSVEAFNTERRSGRALRRKKNDRNLREFSVTIKNMTPCEFEEFKELILQVGSTGTLTWTPPGEVTPIEVNLSSDSFSFNRTSGAAYDVQLSLKEIVNKD